MNTFVLTLYDAQHNEQFADVISFVGEDGSGSFGILPGHCHFMTYLTLGLAKFKCAGQGWLYLALPGGLLSFERNRLMLSTRHYLVGPDHQRIRVQLEKQIAQEERQLSSQKHLLRTMEEQLLKRLWESGKHAPWSL